MKLAKKFNQLSFTEYINVIDRSTDYADFNVLGLFRSISENDRLNPAHQLEIKEITISKFAKIFKFLQLKDLETYFILQTL